jgi:hypothetical protein
MVSHTLLINAMRQALVASRRRVERGAKEAFRTTTSTFLAEPETGKGDVKVLRETTASERVAAGVAFAAVCSASVATAIDQSVVVIVAGIIPANSEPVRLLAANSRLRY